uniref:ZP domain-containing protein n=2 Tax=Caenorhabditis japonica TaxID=281687 RepID=A0A8R1HSY1_CAEJA
MYGVLINNCYVTDGFGKKADVIDGKGCPIDPILITGIRYSSDLQRAYAESSVFKFADKPGVWFFCQVQMCMKKHGMCDGVTPPSCGSMSRVLSAGNGGGFEEEIEEEKPSRKLTKKPPVQDYDYEIEKPKPTKAPTRTTPSANNDYDYDNESPKLHSPNSHTYNSVTPPLDYDTVTLTAFSPPFNPATTTQESVSKTFETEDDLAPSVTSSSIPKSQKISKGETANQL